MNIEVTQRTFYNIFDSTHFVKTEKSELALKHTYYNSELEQMGVIVHNFVGNIKQYYLTDINA